MKVKIISDGTSAGTQVIDEATGERLENIRAAHWSLHAPGLAEATLYVTLVPVVLAVQDLTVTVTAARLSWFKRLLARVWPGVCLGSAG